MNFCFYFCYNYIGDVMYQSLYRKYRPKTFEEVVGQEVPVKILKNAIENDRIAHAYIFAGMRGTGKTSIAKIFARAVNCLDLKDGSPCNKCVICTQNNTDIIEIDAASNNGVDEIRDLRDKIALVPSISKYKVYIIDEVHMLSTSAFNALLKTLEEPPAHAIFILATTEVYKIPLTILSRCQRLDFKGLSIDLILDRLKLICKEEKIKADEEALTEIARLANGGMRDAISLLEQVWSYSDDIKVEDVHKVNGSLSTNEIVQLFKSLIEKDIETSFNYISEYEKEGIDFNKIIDEIIYFARNLILKKNKIQIKDNLYSEEDYKLFENIISVDELIRIIKEFNKASAEIKTVSNKKIVFEMLIINLSDGPRNSVKIPEKVEENKVSKVKETKKEENEELEPKKVDEDAPLKVSEEVKEEQTDNQETEPISNEEILKLKQIRVENTLAEFDKRILNPLQKRLESLKDYTIDLEYKEIALLLLDGKLKAASKEYLIYVFDEAIASNKANSKLLQIESLIKIITGKDLRVITVNNDEWENIKEEFNSKKKEYVKKEETEEIRKIIEKLKTTHEDFLENNFSDIISYE